MDERRNGSRFRALELKPRLDRNVYSLSVTHHNHHEILHHFRCLMVHCFNCVVLGSQKAWWVFLDLSLLKVCSLSGLQFILLDSVSRTLSTLSNSFPFSSSSSVPRTNVILLEGASPKDNGFLGKFFFVQVSIDLSRNVTPDCVSQNDDEEFASEN